MSSESTVHLLEPEIETSVAASDTMVVERRRDERIPCKEKGELEWFDQDFKHRKCDVTVTNVSEGGAQVELSEALPVWSTVRLCFAGQRCFGITRYAKQHDENFVAGIRFDYVETDVPSS